MSNICILDSYQKNDTNMNNELDKILKTAKEESDNMDSFFAKLKKNLKGNKIFSTSYLETKDINNYTQSIDDIIEAIVSYTKENTDYLKTTDDESQFTENLKNLLLPESITETDIAIRDAFPDSPIIPSQKIRSTKYRLFTNSIFEDNAIINISRLNSFKSSMFTSIFIKDGSLVQSALDMNDNILRYMEDQYSIILEYLKSYKGGLFYKKGLFPLSMTRKSKGEATLILKNYMNALQIMRNIIEEETTNKSAFSDKLMEAYEQVNEGQHDNENIKLYRAVLAYTNLVYFDQTLKECFSGYLKIVNKQDFPIIYDDKSGEITPILKYSFTSKNDNAQRQHREIRNSLDEISHYSDVLIGNIPKYNYTMDGPVLVHDTSINKAEFVGAFCMLLEAIKAKAISSGYQKLLKVATNYKYSVSMAEDMLYILKEVFNNKDLRKALLKYNNFNQAHLSTVYSFYATVFKNDKSWFNLEQEHIKQHGSLPKISMVDTLLNLIKSQSTLHYLETTYVYDENRDVTKIKPIYTISKGVFDVTNNANDLNTRRPERITKYSINTDPIDMRIYTITLGSLKFKVYHSDANQNIGLLEKYDNKKFVIQSLTDNIQSLDQILDDVDIKTIKARKALLQERNDPNARESVKQFFEILTFIDEMLGTTFSNDKFGLQKFVMLMEVNKSNFKNLFLSASRALLISDIYYKTTTGEKTLEDGTKKTYDISQVQDAIEDLGLYITSFKNYDENKKGYFITKFGVNYLATVSPTESWVTDLATITAILNGDSSKAVISNLSSNKIPNYSPSFMGSDIENQLLQLQDVDRPLLFKQNRANIVINAVDTDIKLQNGEVKSIRDMSASELMYHSIVDTFLNPLVTGQDRVYIQPTVYSDKTKYLIYGISLEGLPGSTYFQNQEKFEQEVIKSMYDTIGEDIKYTWRKVEDDYRKLWEQIGGGSEYSLELFANKLSRMTMTELNQEIMIYNDNHPNSRLEFIRDQHFREMKNGKLAINEVIYHYVNGIFRNEISLRKMLEKERLAFLNSLLDERVPFIVTTVNGEIKPDNIDNNTLTQALSKFIGSEVKIGKSVQETDNSWVKGNRMILAKIKDSNGKVIRNVTYGNIKLEDGQTIEVNPLLNIYFFYNNLFSSNIRAALTGYEFNHPNKELSKTHLNNVKLNETLTIGDITADIATLNDNYKTRVEQTEDNTLTMFDIQKALFEYERLKSITPDIRGYSKAKRLLTQKRVQNLELLKSWYDQYIITTGVSALQNTQFKRNVSIPGTMYYFDRGNITGIGSTYKVAVVNDIKGDVFNFSGQEKSIEVHDGMARIDPFTDILEKNSLLDNNSGSVKKPLHQWNSKTFGTSGLLKYATAAITNSEMLKAEGNALFKEGTGITLKNLFKKMTNLRWSQLFGLNEDRSSFIDLVYGCEYRNNSQIIFESDILKEGEKALYYNDGGKHNAIIDFGIENGVYYTDECLDVKSGNLNFINDKDVKKVRYYHYFNENSEHFKSTKLRENQDLHTIDSLYELHTALGGIYSEEWTDKFAFSERSNEAVVSFMNLVAIEKDPNATIINQSSYRQPLKEACINVVANQTAMKNGAANVNETSVYYNDERLNYMVIPTSGYGIQMDADHKADEAEMTEFSQVIASLDRGGVLHDYVSNIYKALGQLSLQLSKIELDAIEEFQNTKNKNKLYDIVARTILNNLLEDKGQAGLGLAILDKIEKELNINTDHIRDTFLIPFSDYNIYQTILSTFVSTINHKSIKRKYPGTGMIMVASYDIAMVFDINGHIKTYDDILKEALANKDIPQDILNINDISRRNKEIVKIYLRQLQEQQKEFSIEEFQPTDNVYVTYKIDGEVREAHISLQNRKDYYNFKDSPIRHLVESELGQVHQLKTTADGIVTQYLDKDGFPHQVTISDVVYKKDVMVPRNLAPAKIQFKYEGSDKKIHTMSIFDHWRVREQIEPQKAFDELSKGIYIDKSGVQYNIIGDVKVTEAEMMSSRMYKSKFGLDDSDSINDILVKGPKYFLKNPSVVHTDNADLVFTSPEEDGSLYISFKPNFIDKQAKAIEKKWKYVIPIKKDGDNEKIKNRLYAATKDNIPLFQIGRTIDVTGEVKRDANGKFIRDGQVLNNQSDFTYDPETHKIYENVYFITKKEVTERRNNCSRHYTLYNINSSELRRVYPPKEYTKKTYKKDGKEVVVSEEEQYKTDLNNYIGSILADIYKKGDYSGIAVQSELTNISLVITKATLNKLTKELNYDENLSDYVKELRDILNDKTKVKIDREHNVHIIDRKSIMGARNRYAKKQAQLKYESFKKSQYFTVSRIPAQTLQSFMKMKNVGFINTDSAICYVSHWQLWLQGSDYDIDKAYVMGFAFDANSRYIGWSSLFDYSSQRTIEASELLNFPSRRNYIRDVRANINIDKELEEINSLEILETNLKNQLNDPQETENPQEIQKKLIDTKVSKLKLYAKLINQLSKLPEKLNYNGKFQYIIDKVNKHENTEFPADLIQDATKNFISSHIQYTVQHLRNMIPAYSPITLKDLSNAADKSPKGQLTKKLTLFNPATVFIMQYQNMVGKDDIGISANGEKTSFMWHYYLNEAIRNFSDEEIEHTTFNYTTSRIVNRHKENWIPEAITINTLPEVNFEGVDEKRRLKFGNKLYTGTLSVDLLISQLLSAATDSEFI